MSQSDIAMIGLGVMGKSLALNLLDHDFAVSGYDIQATHRAHTQEEAIALGKGLYVNAGNLDQLLASLKSPRILVLSVPAGAPVDSAIDSLIEAGLEARDIVIDTGNSLWTDSEARERKYYGKLRFFSTAVSGGEAGARHGPALMASGDLSAWSSIRPMWEAIAAKVDSNGLPLPSFEDGEPCAAYLGPAGAGHYVKMVHNGIEYADMQLICEAYQMMSDVLGMSPNEVGEVFEQWNHGELNSYLMEISADILKTTDPETGQPFVSIVLDKAGQKGTGLWTAVNSLQEGSPAPTIAQAVFARAQSAQKSLRIKASTLIDMPTDCGMNPNNTYEKEAVLAALKDALYCAKISVYAQGFALMKEKSDKENWQLDMAQIAKTWRAGCIIRAAILHQITLAFDAEPTIAHLLFAKPFIRVLSEKSLGWRKTVAQAAMSGVPAPGISASLHYVDTLRTATLPANLLQAQRDYFGAHTYARVDCDESRRFHFSWHDVPREEVEF
ncbi:NADP-dependent phosphogluconate dehydrogenase [Enterovibrio calviensis]|uniref:NADP-dependent phosphogluconate dehydrogenase n=1 Tax=Enterovibrio calviensis TaxID=91359 RepID=UPI003736DF19